MPECKKLIWGFAIKNGKAFRLDDHQNPMSEEPAALAAYYSNNGADEIFLSDISETEEDHEATIGLIKKISGLSDIPFITGGRVKRLEDVKKYLYTGAKAVYFDAGLDENIDLIKESADRFGEEKIYVCLPESSFINRVEEYIQLGASCIILSGGNLTDQELNEVKECDRDILIISNQHMPSITRFLSSDFVSGVIINQPDDLPQSIPCFEMKHELSSKGILVNLLDTKITWEELKLNPQGLIPVIVQNYQTSQVLMMAYMNQEAFAHTLANGRMTYYSRSRQKLWMKGETSGHYQYVKSLTLDCDNDTILAKVNQIGPACHTGATTCFYQPIVKKEYKETNPLKVFEDVFQLILKRKNNPKEGSYTNYLIDKGIDKILKKIGEEASEIIIASKNKDTEEVKYEISDFLYHMMVLMAVKGITWEDITKEMSNR